MLHIEKALFLKSIGVFSAIPAHALLELTAALQKLELPAGETLFRRGDLGTSMYLIASGRVRIHDAERELVTLDSHMVFGELAALDTEPRAASATTVTDCVLFRLEQETLYELMSERVELARGIIGYLCASVRGKR